MSAIPRASISSQPAFVSNKRAALSARSCRCSLISAQSESAGDDAAENFTRAAAQAEGGRGLQQQRERSCQVAVVFEPDVLVDERLHQWRQRLLERIAEILDDRSRDHRILTGRELAGDG